MAALGTASPAPRASGGRATLLDRTPSSFLHQQIVDIFDTPAQNWEAVVVGTLAVALVCAVGVGLAGTGNIGYAVAWGVLYGVCYGAVFWCAFDPQRHAAWLAPGTWTLHAFLVATSALRVAGAYMFASVNTDRHGSGEWLPLYIAGRFIYIFVQLLLCGVVLFRAHADEHRGLFFTVVAAFFFYFLSTVGQASPYTWLEGPGAMRDSGWDL